MANRLPKDGYGQLELNQVAFRRDGRIEAQCKLVKDIDFVENGMILAVDNVTRTIAYPTANSTLVALNYTTEHMYDERTPGLKNFKLDNGTFLPRLGYLAKGDKFTTNTVDLGSYADLDAVKEAFKNRVPVQAGPGLDGYITFGAQGTCDLVLEVVEITTMPDGQDAFKFQVIDC